MYIVRAELKLYLNKGLFLWVAVAGLLSAIAGYTGDFVSKDRILPDFTIYISDNDNSVESRLLVKELESFKPEVMTVVLADKSFAAESVKNGGAAAVIIPQGFFANILAGNNVKAQLIVNNENPLASQIIRAFADSVRNQLLAGQAGVYAVAAGSENNYTYVYESNMVFFSVFMGRAVESSVLPSYGGAAGLGYFALCFYLLLMFLLPAFIIDKASALNDVMRILVLKGTKYAVLYRFLSVLILYVLVNLLLMTVLVFAFGIKFSYFAAAIIILCQSAFGFLWLAAFESAKKGAVVIFMVQLVCAFFSGSIVPLPFLPEALRRFSVFTPNYHLVNLVLSGGAGFSVIVMSMMVLGCSFILWRIRLRNC